MTVALRSLAVAVALVSLVPYAAAQPAAAPSPGTLGDWIVRDRATGRLEPSPDRTAALEAPQRDVVAALQAARAAVEAQTAAGQSGGTCLPPPGTVQLTSDEIGAWLYTRPPGDYGDTMEQVMLRFLAYRFPCP